MIPETSIGHDIPVAAPTDEVVHRLSNDLSDDVPQGQLDTAERDYRQPSLAETLRSPVHLVEKELHVEWAATDQQWFESFNQICDDSSGNG